MQMPAGAGEIRIGLLLFGMLHSGRRSSGRWAVTVLRAIAVLGAVLGFVGPASAADAIPNLVGTWTGTFTGGVRLGGGDLAPADAKPTFVHENMNRVYTLKINEQQGRGMIGTWSSVKGSEAIQGVVRM